MTREEYYLSMVHKYDVMIEEATKTHSMTRAKRDRERIEYLKERRKRYLL